MSDISLPVMPSELIRLARADLRKVEANPRYTPDMGAWHMAFNKLTSDKTCHVCLAGAVMAGTLGANPNDSLEPEDYPEDVGDALAALNHFRYADDIMRLKSACNLLGASIIVWNEAIPSYDEDREGFHAALGRLADAFEKSGQ